MSKNVLVLGASGRFGRAAIDAFHQAGWSVTALSRPGGKKPMRLSPAIRQISADARNPAELARCAKGNDVIVHALNPPYPLWSKELPVLTASVIHAARESGATVMIPGNVYAYGEDMPTLLTEETAHQPTTVKGRLREELEQAFQDAAAAGVRTIVLRCGDFLEGEKTGNWFDSHIADRIARGIFRYPGNPDIPHAWAYLPDAARAMTILAARRAELEAYETFNFAGISLSGNELRELLGKSMGRDLELRKFPWVLARLMALVSPMLREVLEMRYLWDVPHALDGRKFARFAPGFLATPAEEIIADLATGLSGRSVDRIAPIEETGWSPSPARSTQAGRAHI